MQRREFLLTMSAGILVGRTVSSDVTVSNRQASSEPTQETDPFTRNLDDAASHLTAAYNSYLDYGADEATFHDIDASVSVPPERLGLSEHLYSARDALHSAENNSLTQAQRTTVIDLWGVQWLFWWLWSIHDSLHEGYRDIGAAWEALLVFHEPRDWVRDASERLEAVETDLNKLRQDSDPTHMESFEPLSETDYRQKITRIEKDAALIRTLGDLFADELHESLARLEFGIAALETEEYLRALEALEGATFGAIIDQIRDIEWTQPFVSIVEQLVCLSQTLDNGTRALIEVALAGADGNSVTASYKKRQSKEQFTTCDLVFKHLHFVKQFY
jgi:exonuclease VII small subunit